MDQYSDVLPRSEYAGFIGGVWLFLWMTIFPATNIYGQQATLAGPAAGEWGRRAPLQEPNSEISVAELNGKIYVVGGYPSDRVTVPTVQVYDAAQDRWKLTTPLPVPLNHTMAASVNGKLYVIGGQTIAQSDSSFVDSVYEYDPATQRWTSRAPMPTQRSAGGAVVVGGKIYVAGGRPPRGRDFAVYDPRANSWTPLPDLPTQRNHLAAVAIEGKVFVAGGRFGGGVQSETTDVVEIFDPATNTWTPGAPMLIPRGGINGVVAAGCLHVFGGEGNRNDPNGMFSDHDLYDPITKTWTRLDPMPVPVHGVTGAVFLNNLIYLPGGGTARGGTSGSTIHQVYRPKMNCR